VVTLAYHCSARKSIIVVVDYQRLSCSGPVKVITVFVLLTGLQHAYWELLLLFFKCLPWPWYPICEKRLQSKYFSRNDTLIDFILRQGGPSWLT